MLDFKFKQWTKVFGLVPYIMYVDPPLSYTSHYSLKKYADGDQPGASALNEDKDTIDTEIYNAANAETYTATLPILITTKDITLEYNTTNFKLTSDELNTIQDIASSSLPTFTGLILTGNISASNGFFSGDVVVQGRLTAEEIYTEYESASVIYSSGSTKFGDSLDDTHNFTGSIYVNNDIFLEEGGRLLERVYGGGEGGDTGGEYSTFVAGIGSNVYFGPTSSFADTYLRAGTGTIKFGFGSPGAVKASLSSLGYLALGSAKAATAVLDVSGSIGNIVNVTTSTQANSLLIGSTGYVGLGTTTLSERLNVAGNIKQSGNVSMYNNFSSGWAGTGWRIDEGITGVSSTIEATDMFLRGTLSVYELLIQQIRATNGSVFITAACRASGSATIKAGDPSTQDIYFENVTGQGVTPFAVGDIIMTQRAHLSGSVIIKRCVRTVTSLNGLTASCNVLDPPGDTGFVSASDDFVRIGNVTDTDRDASIYLTSDDSNAPFIDILDGVNSWAAWTDKSKVKARLGRLSGIPDDTFGTLDGYGLYANRVYLTTGIDTGSAGILLKAESGSAQFTMKQSSNTIFDFNTATSTAKIAGWSFDKNRLWANSATGYSHLELHGSGSHPFIYAGFYQSEMGTDDVAVVFGRLLAAINSSYTGQTGIYGYDKYNRIEYFILTDTTRRIAGWTFDGDKLYNSTNIILDGTNKKVSVAGDAVKMYYTDITHYGITATGFHLGSTNQIAGWVFTTASLYNGVYANDFNKVALATVTENYGGTNYFWNGANLGKGFNQIYKSGSFAHAITVGEILSDITGSCTNGADRNGWNGIQMVTAPGTGTPFVLFQLSGKANSYRNEIAGWRFDFAKLYKGTAATGLALNVSSIAFITGTGFEVYDPSNPKLFIGNKAGEHLDYNVTTAGELTLSGSIIGSTITGGIIQTAASGKRVVINEGNANTIKWYTTSGKTLTMNPVDQGSYAGLEMGENYFYFESQSYSSKIDYAVLSITSGSYTCNIRPHNIYLGSYNVSRYIGTGTANIHTFEGTDIRAGDMYISSSGVNYNIYVAGNGTGKYWYKFPVTVEAWL